MTEDSTKISSEGGVSYVETTKKVTPPIPLDWTKLGKAEAPEVRQPQDVAEVDPESTELCIVGTAGQKITHMGNDLSRIYGTLKKVILRSHVISEIKGLQNLPELELLELYDNAVTSLEGIQPWNKLTVLDMSYNSIRDMAPVASCVNLTELYLAQNKLKEISGLKQLKYLKKLDLGANRIRIMEEEELSGLANLEELWLGKNKIEAINGINKLTKLRRLDVQANRLTTVENLSSQVDTLEELYLSHNGIGNRGASQNTGLALPFTKLITLDLSRNRLKNTDPFHHLVSTLQDLWLSGNKISSYNDVRLPATQCVLESLYLEYNPVASEPGYRQKLISMYPTLKQLDAVAIRPGERDGTVSLATTYPGTSPSYSTDFEEASLDNFDTLMKQKQDMAILKAKEQMEEKLRI